MGLDSVFFSARSLASLASWPLSRPWRRPGQGAARRPRPTATEPCPTVRATVSASRAVECPRRTVGVWSPCASPTPAPHGPAACPDGRPPCSAGPPPCAARRVPRAGTRSWSSGSPPAPGVARSRRVALSAFVIGLRLVGSTLGFRKAGSPRRVTSACRELVLVAVRRTSLRRFGSRASVCCGSGQAATSAMPSRPCCNVHLRATGRVLSARFGSVRSRALQHPPGTCACSYRDRQSRASRRRRRPGGRPNRCRSPRSAPRLTARTPTLRRRHASDPSAWRAALPVANCYMWSSR